MNVSERKQGVTTLDWEEPPALPPRGRRPWWWEVIPKVAERPGFWAAVRVYETGVESARVAAHDLRKCRDRGEFPMGSWEIRHGVVGGVGKVYVKYTEV